MKGMPNKLKIRKFLTFLLLCILCVGVLGCKGTKSGDTSRRPAFSVVTADGVRVSLSINARLINKNYPVGVCLSVTNLRKKNLRLVSNSAQLFEFTIYLKKGTRVWRWSDGKFFAQVVTEIKFAPGETRNYRISLSAKKLEPGEYVLEGVFTPLANLKPRVGFSVTE